MLWAHQRAHICEQKHRGSANEGGADTSASYSGAAAHPATSDRPLRCASSHSPPADRLTSYLAGGCPGGTLEVFVESRAFEGQTLVAQHKWVKSLLRDEIRDVHAITLQTALPAPSS